MLGFWLSVWLIGWESSCFLFGLGGLKGQRMKGNLTPSAVGPIRDGYLLPAPYSLLAGRGRPR